MCIWECSSLRDFLLSLSLVWLFLLGGFPLGCSLLRDSFYLGEWHIGEVIVSSFCSGRWQVADWLFPCALKQVVIWVNVSLSLVLSGFRNSGNLRLRYYWEMAGMGFPFCRFSGVPDEN